MDITSSNKNEGYKMANRTTLDGGRNEPFDYSDPYDEVNNYKAPPLSTPQPTSYFTKQPQTETQKLFGANQNPFAFTEQQDGPYGSTAAGFGVTPMQEPAMIPAAATPAAQPFDYNSIYNNGNFDTNAYANLDSAGRKTFNDTTEQKRALAALEDANSFDWLGATNVGLQGLNTAMEIGVYGDKKDYMKNVNKGLEQNMTNAQATHDNRATQQQNLGSTFSRNA